MEQPNQILSVAPSATEVDSLQWHEEKAKIVFEKGMYRAEGLEGYFMTTETLKRAWKAFIRKNKLAEAASMMRKSTRKDTDPKEKKKLQSKAIEEKLKWQAE